MMKARLAVAVLISAMTATLAACGAGGSTQGVEQRPPPVSVADVPTTTAVSPASGTVPTTVATTAPTTSTPSPAAVLNPQPLDQVSAELGALDKSLSTVGSDLNQPQGDS